MKEKKIRKNKYYITTPIYYVNDVPHIGHSYTTIAADTLARYKRFIGDDVFFLTGTDEHGQKIQKTAQEKGKTPKELADSVVKNFKSLWEKLDISNDFFVRTTDDYHIKCIQEAFKRIYEKGDIYKGEYEGWYCVPCESYHSENDVGKNRVCPDCGRAVELVKEESYFFKLSAYQDKLLEFYENNPDFVVPKTRYNEIKSFVKGGLRDLSITRTSFDWGIKVPFDEKHVVYVWFDALLNYISAIGYPFDEKFRQIWPADVHFVGKDILKFHAVYWPAFLMALNLPLPKHIAAHGWWTADGKKMSKSLGNVVDPNEMIRKYPKDAYRYFLLRNVPFGLDGDFSEKELVGRINAELVNDLGNLLNRTLTMAEKYSDSIVEKPDNIQDDSLNKLSAEIYEKIDSDMNRFRFDEALSHIFEFIRAVNKYITVKEPWTLKKQNREQELKEVIYNVVSSLIYISGMLLAFMPDTAKEMWKQLGFTKNIYTYPLSFFLNFYSIDRIHIQKGNVLFEKIETDKKQKEDKKEEKISIDEFFNVDLRTAKILSAESVEKSKKLIKLKVDAGEEKPRTLVAGLKEYYKPEELVGKTVVIVANLKPAKLMGIESNGMLLAAKDGKSLGLLTTSDSDNVKPGSKVG